MEKNQREKEMTKSERANEMAIEVEASCVGTQTI